MSLTSSTITTETAYNNKNSLAGKVFATLFSYIFHPLFIPLYVTLFVAFVHPNYFSGFSVLAKKKIVLLISFNTILFPAVVVLLLKGLGFSRSVFLRTQKDRIIPYIASMTFFFWTYYVLREQNYIPRILVEFMFGVFIATAAALLFNIYQKISMHAIGMGGLLGIFFIIMQSNTMLMAWPVCVVLLISGAVCTSRLLISDHSSKEIYTGLFVGLACQLIASFVVS
ncbi:hypothetical protein [Ferruginibacter albus]|uniref:hypothetical protein n=1 Tax=Ferruginibacter albus TaxID=2875540 RepID=UPI001CC704E0|nr:hypothetical protein [Ferruginibacter albus]UAY51957.1 hypothetical protein K9M53_15365 [Ferruginibacter albus]